MKQLSICTALQVVMTLVLDLGRSLMDLRPNGSVHCTLRPNGSLRCTLRPNGVTAACTLF